MLEIRIKTKLNKIVEYSAVGHSNNTCGSVTCVSRTFIQLARDISGVEVPFDIPKEGHTSFEVIIPVTLPQHLAAYLDGLSQFVLKAVTDLAAEFPDEVNLMVKAEV